MVRPGTARSSASWAASALSTPAFCRMSPVTSRSASHTPNAITPATASKTTTTTATMIFHFTEDLPQRTRYPIAAASLSVGEALEMHGYPGAGLHVENVRPSRRPTWLERATEKIDAGMRKALAG